MADKKYYYLQLESSLFSNMKMMMLDRQKDKKELLYFLIQLSVMSIENEGKIMLDDEPASIETLSLLTGEDEKDIEKWIIILMKLKLVSNINGTYLVDFASERIGSITDRALRKQKEKLRNSEGTIKELSGTKAEQVPQSSEELPQYKSKSYNKSKSKKLDIELKKDKKIKKDIDIKLDKDEKALLEKDAVDVYNFYKDNIKLGNRKKTIERLITILAKQSKQSLINAISNYKVQKDFEGTKDIKFIKAPENFFSLNDETYINFLSENWNNPYMQQELNELKKNSWNWKNNAWTEFGKDEVKDVKAKYNITAEEDDKDIIEVTEFKIIGGK